jgi:hypothetical protein
VNTESLGMEAAARLVHLAYCERFPDVSTRV